MKKKSIFFAWGLTAILLFVVITLHVGAQSTFKFPGLIEFKLLKDNKTIGNCILVCTEKTGRKGYNRELASLKLLNFQGLGYNRKNQLHTNIYRDDLSLFMETVIKGKKWLSQVRIRKAAHADGKTGLIHVYKQIKSKDEKEREIHNQHKVIGFLSSLIAASERVAAGRHKIVERFNLVLNKNLKIVDMVYDVSEIVDFKGKKVSAEVLSIVEPGNNTEIFRVKIIKDNQGNCFPVRILFKDQKKGVLELRAQKVQFSPNYWGIQPLFVVNLAFVDAGAVMGQTVSAAGPSDTARLINRNVAAELNRQFTASGAAWRKRVYIDKKGHTIPYSIENAKNLVFTALNPDLADIDKMKMISGEVFEKYDVDVIVTGQYIENGSTGGVIIRPVIISRPGKKIITEKWVFNIGELVCSQGSAGNRELVLCRDALDKIAALVKTVGERPPAKQVPSLVPLYATILEFLNHPDQTVKKQTEETRLIMAVFRNVLTNELTKLEKSRNKQLFINQAGHSVPYEAENIENIDRIVFDSFLSREDKIRNVVDQVLAPNHVDGIVTCRYIIDTLNPNVTIRPIVVFKSGKQILTKNLQFKKDELISPGPGGKGKILHKAAHQKITAEVRKFLAKLHK